MARPKAGYATRDGRPVPGVTTICGLLAKPALVGWAGKTCTDLAWQAGKRGDPLPKWSELLYGVRDAAAEAGTLVHELFESYLRGKPLPEVPDTDIGKAAAQGFQNAQSWLDTSALVIEPHEKPLVSELHRFGGTPDATARSRDKRFLADWKTGALYPEHLIQMAAYRHLLQECDDIAIDGCHLVRFSREHGDFAHHYFGSDALDLGWQVFSHLLIVRSDLDALARRVK